MAYVPDAAIDRLDEISPKAAQLYARLCRHRDHKTGYSRRLFENVCDELGLSRPTKFRVRRELLDGDWITLNDAGRVGLRGGDFACVDKTATARLVWETPHEKSQSLNSETAPKTSLNLETGSLKTETNSLHSETVHIKDRARVSSSTPSSTLTPAHALSLVADAPTARVRVSNRTEEELKRYADAKGLGGGWLTKARRTGEWDSDVTDWLESRKAENVQKARSSPPQTRQTEGQVFDLLRSMLLGFPSYDVAGYIAQLTDFDKEAKTRLLAKFPSIPVATAPPAYAGRASAQRGVM